MGEKVEEKQEEAERKRKRKKVGRKRRRKRKRKRRKLLFRDPFCFLLTELFCSAEKNPRLRASLSHH